MENEGSILVVDSMFSAEDPGFVATLRTVFNGNELAVFAKRWCSDPRPWAREQMLAYILEPWDRPGHRPVLKALFKNAEVKRWDDVMAAMLVALDRLVRRRLVTRHRWNPAIRDVEPVEHVVTPRNTLRDGSKGYRNPRTAGQGFDRAPRKGRLLFTARTRYHLRRRAWRYLHYIGAARQGGPRYIAAASSALALYRDEDFPSGLALLDSPGLLHLLFGASPHLKFGPHHAALAEGADLASLHPAPVFPVHWKEASGFQPLLALLVQARARTVRQAVVALLREFHGAALKDLPPSTVRGLLDHEDADVQEFGASLLSGLESIAALPVADWLLLLDIRNPTAQALVVEAMRKHVDLARLTFEDSLGLARARSVAVARLGLSALKERVFSDEDRRQLATLAGMRCEAMAPETIPWALGTMGAPTDDEILLFLDSNSPAVRTAAWELVAGFNATVLARLTESPHGDIKEKLLPLLEKLGECAEGHMRVWASLLLDVHRGSRLKPRAAECAAEAVARDASLAPDVLAVLGAVLRSLRAPEVRTALGAIARIARERPELRGRIATSFPELVLEEPS